MIALVTSDWRSTAPWASRGRVRVPRKWALARPLGRTAEEERRSLEGGPDMRSGAIIQETFHEYWFDQAERRRHFCRQDRNAHDCDDNGPARSAVVQSQGAQIRSPRALRLAGVGAGRRALRALLDRHRRILQLGRASCREKVWKFG